MLTTEAGTVRGNAVLRLGGMLHARTYRQARDAVIKTALDVPTAVIVDVDELEVPDDRAWAVFTSARWHVHHWPQVVIALACSDPAVRDRLGNLSISRYVPVFGSVTEAAQAIGDGNCRYRLRASRRIGPQASDINAAQSFVTDHLTQWSMEPKIPVVLTVATIFVENALIHTGLGCDLRLETIDGDIVVAVSDTSTAPAIRRERAPGSIPTGLDVVAAICGRWGSSPTPTGKTVWARIRPDDTVTAVSQLLQP